jgi:hypothetical protein
MTDATNNPEGELAGSADLETLKIGQGKPGPGRPKGMPNRTTALLKDAILRAAQDAGGEDGMVGYLTLQAKTNPGPFMALLGKVLPMQIAGDNENPLYIAVVERRLVKPNAGN